MGASRSFILPKRHVHNIVDIQFDHTGDYLASCALDGTVAVYALSLQCYTHAFEIDQTPSCMGWVLTKTDFLSLVVGCANGDLHQIIFMQGNV